MTVLEKKQKTWNTKLFVRIIPTLDLDFDSIKIEKNKQVMHIRCTQDFTKGVQIKNPNYWSFCTDGIFWNCTQAEVYQDITFDLFDNIFEGINALILCYGQTGAGKTFTTSGLRYNFQHRGLILRILSQLFSEAEQRQDISRIHFGITYIEFIGEKIKDLINDRPVEKLRDIMEYYVPNEEVAWRKIFSAERKKSFTREAPYVGSNKGHSVLTLYIHNESLVDTDPVTSHSKIHLVDMAGIDCMGNKPSAWKDKWTLGQSNLTKTLIEQLILCMTGTAWKEENHICPYKSSRFVTYLHETLNPKCLIKFVAHIYGNRENLSTTISTMKFGEKLKAFKPTKLERIVEDNCILQMRNLQKENQKLKEEAEINSMLRDSPDYTNISQDRLHEIKRAAEGFFSGQLENLTLFSLGQANLTLEVFKELYQKLSTEKDQMIKDAVATATELLQNQMTAERFANASVAVVPSTQRVSRRKSRQDSQNNFNTTFRSSDSNQGAIGKVSSAIQQVGMTDRKGISLGPGKTSSICEGNIIKAFKRLKSRRSESVIKQGSKVFPTKDIGIPLPKIPLEEIGDLTGYQDIPTREIAWQNFIAENSCIIENFTNDIESTEYSATTAKKKYMNSLKELSQIREEVRKIKVELQNCQHIRKVSGKENDEEDEDPMVRNAEKTLSNLLVQREEQLNANIEMCHVALIDFKSFAQQWTEAKNGLENAFQDYCMTNYKFIYPPEDNPDADFKEKEINNVQGTPCDLEPKLTSYLKLYNFLQKTLNKKPTKFQKREWK